MDFNKLKCGESYLFREDGAIRRLDLYSKTQTIIKGAKGTRQVSGTVYDDAGVQIGQWKMEDADRLEGEWVTTKKELDHRQAEKLRLEAEAAREEALHKQVVERLKKLGIPMSDAHGWRHAHDRLTKAEKTSTEDFLLAWTKLLDQIDVLKELQK